MKRPALLFSALAALLALSPLHAQTAPPIAPPAPTPFEQLQMDEPPPLPRLAAPAPTALPSAAPSENPLANIELPPSRPLSTPSPAAQPTAAAVQPTAAAVQPFASPSSSPPPQNVASLDPAAKLTPRAQPLLAASDAALGNGQLIGYFAVLALLVLAGVYFLRRGFSLRAGRNTEQRLHILETKMLGNRQFLLVVAYEDSRMLLGVSPGKIEFLTALDAELPETAEMINLGTIPPSKLAPDHER